MQDDIGAGDGPDQCDPDQCDPDRGGSALAAIVAARICHDLVSPVGAIANGIDLIAEIGPGETADEFELVRQSAARASAMLRLQRLAFGTAGAGATPLSRTDLEAQLRAVVAGRRVALEITGTDGPPLAAPVARLGALMTLAARAMLGLSGSVRLDIAPGGLPLSTTTAGAAAAASERARRWIAGGSAPLPEAREVEIALLHPAAAPAGARLHVETGPGLVRLHALPA